MGMEGVHFKVPTQNRFPSCLRQLTVARKNLIQSFLLEQDQRLLQSVEEVGRRSLGENRLPVDIQLFVTLFLIKIKRDPAFAAVHLQ